jgi:hypothetical protein
LLFVLICYLLPSHTPLLTQIVNQPNEYARSHLSSLGWWSLSLLAFATLLGGMMADPRLPSKLTDAAAHPYIKWLTGISHTDIRIRSAWSEIFNMYAKENPGFIDVGILVDDGSYLRGRLHNFAVQPDETDNRDIVISAPLELTLPGKEPCPIDPQYCIISSRHIVPIDVTHLAPVIT